MSDRNLRFAVSTAAFPGRSIEWILETCAREGLTLEFSSGLKYSADLEAIYLSATIPRLPHNYFPPPAEPFVLNLASLDDTIAQRSTDHCIHGIELAARTGAPFFSAHAGFCFDPAPAELGQKFHAISPEKRDGHWARFIAAIHAILDVAERHRVKFLVENNVCTDDNVLPDGSSPLLCADGGEAAALLREVDRPSLGLLLDTGHLKVSARAMSFAPESMLEAVGSSVIAVHHSDNDGRRDTNRPLGNDYWFLQHVASFADCLHVLEVNDQDIEQIHRQRQLLYDATFSARRQC